MSHPEDLSKLQAELTDAMPSHGDEHNLGDLSILELRALLPPGRGASPEQMAAEAWGAGDDEAARFAYAVADRIREIKLAL